jgi:CheY-like chemotaxis protein
VVAVNAFRVLVVDDEPEMCAEAERQIMEIQGPVGIDVDHAYTPSRAIERVKARFYDLILLDLYRQKELAGYEVFRRLSEIGCSADVLLMTRFNLDPSVKALMKVLASNGGPRLVGFFDKREQGETNVREEVRKRYDRHLLCALETENLGLASRILDRRRKRYQRPGVFPLRQDPAELEVEVERLLRALYVEIPSAGSRSLDVSVCLEPMERRGLSAAVVVGATVIIGLRGEGEVHEGHRTVLKIGPRGDIFEEASRFREFVRYGVELDQRVELLALAGRDSLGALVYSFAGGVFRKTLLPLDELLMLDLESGDSALSREVLGRLFKSRHWYSVRASDVGVSQYFKANYRTELLRSCETAEREMAMLPEVLGNGISVSWVDRVRKDEPHFVLSFPNRQTLVLPDSSVLGLGNMHRPAPACLVHGDMHAGNVMIELSRSPYEGAEAATRLDRVCLIDFRNSGPGPRSVDAVALESSVRLADSEASCRALGGVGESFLSADARFEVALHMSERFHEEMALYDAIFAGESSTLFEGWQNVAAEILRGLRECFPELTLTEYLSTSIRYTLRQLGYDMEPVARVRLLSWLAAQYALQKRISSESG